MTATEVDYALPTGRRRTPARAPAHVHAAALARGVSNRDIFDLLGHGGGLPWDVWKRKLPTVAALAGSTSQVDLDSPVDVRAELLDRFTKLTGLQTRRAGLIAHRDHPAVLADITALSSDGGIILIDDIAHNAAATRLAEGLPVPERLSHAARYALLATGRSHAWLLALRKDTYRMEKVRFAAPSRSREADFYIPRVESFVRRYLDPQIPPHIPYTPRHLLIAWYSGAVDACTSSDDLQALTDRVEASGYVPDGFLTLAAARMRQLDDARATGYPDPRTEGATRP